jgi:ferritin-like metal-binding protein YciE
LQDVSENQLTEALPKLAKAVTAEGLVTAFEKHLKETRGHIARLNQALRGLGQEKRRRKPARA